MREYVIFTDNTADLPADYLSKNGVEKLFLNYTIDGQTYEQTNELPVQEFYEKMRGGSMPTTSQINPENAREAFMQKVKEGYDILYIAFSSGLSGSCGSAQIAANQIMEEMPEVKILVVDSLCASLGEGLFVDYAVELKKAGKDMEEIAGWLEEHKLNFCHVFTVDDLNHLYRGGRVSKAAAVLGTMINIKPVLHVDNEGHLIPLGKVRGRKKSLIKLVDMMEERIGSFRDRQTKIFISHGDCLEDAEFVKQLVQERFGYQDFLINMIGATIGTHSGPGTVALFFLGDHR